MDEIIERFHNTLIIFY